ncbi:MAG: preprotein translocase subunit SecG [Woeseiaceae bacterium]
MQQAVLIGHTLIAILIIVLVLLQRGKGADAGAGFGAGASGTVFGSRGSSSFFSRATAVLATAFFVSSLTLAYLSSQRTTGPTSLLDDAPTVEQEVEAVPAEDEDLPLPDLEPLNPTNEDPTSEGPVDTAGDEIGGLPSLDDEAPAEEGTQSE